MSCSTMWSLHAMVFSTNFRSCKSYAVQIVYWWNLMCYICLFNEVHTIQDCSKEVTPICYIYPYSFVFITMV
jgi:hypothetical protein